MQKMSDRVKSRLAEFLFKKQNRHGKWDLLNEKEQRGWLEHAGISLRNQENAGLIILAPEPILSQAGHDLSQSDDIVAACGDHVVLEQSTEKYLTQEEALRYAARIATTALALPRTRAEIVYVDRIPAA